MQNSEAYPSSMFQKLLRKIIPFTNHLAPIKSFMIIFQVTEKRESNSNTNDLINELINSLIQEKVAKPEICGDGQDNDGNGQIDEYCDVSNPPQGDDSIPSRRT